METAIDYSNRICFRCPRCNEPKIILTREYLKRLRNNLRKQAFCGPRCGRLGMKHKDDVKRQIAETQKGISVLARGRIGHAISGEVRAKIRLSKTGKPSKKDWSNLEREIALNGFNKFATTQHVVPDAIVVRDGKLIAIEIERERWESGVRHKMKSCDEYPAHGYDEVLLFWYTPDNIRRKVWTLKDGEWSLTWTMTLS